ncbi:hypothetical protein [Thiohalocapsa sp. ML1]|uniref:hypothetical protein n=1 Tax=Thiohalocapsa sp. ML1 TaxID=1431688 RepID=UPI00138F238D|nr:hypothetical protein [Thiohalocapsa sp. ML1]
MDAPVLPLGHRPPLLDERLETLFAWLQVRELVGEGGNMDLPTVNLDAPQLLNGASFALAEPTARRHRVKRKQAQEMKTLKERLGGTPPNSVDKQAVWGAVQTPHEAVRKLAWHKLPPDAMAFYRPFHYPPFDQWGIYLLVEPLLAYHCRLQRMAAPLKLYSPEVLMHLVLFEVFHHEFFHHMAETTATSLEILAAARGQPRRVYLDFWHRQYDGDGFDYPHAPLEEALANAYAHNALGFIARVKAGYRTAVIRSYQAALETHWDLEPPGYRDARAYIKDGYVAGGACLLAQMLEVPNAADEVPLACLARHLMPNGFTALLQKPEIPTYLVGSDEQLDALHALVPAPNEAYSQLFWPYDSRAIDAYVAEMKAKEKAAREAAKRAGTANALGLRQGDLFA